MLQFKQHDKPCKPHGDRLDEALLLRRLLPEELALLLREPRKELRRDHGEGGGCDDQQDDGEPQQK